MTEPQWLPTAQDVEEARVTDFARFAGRPDSDYHALWRWSVDEPAAFWAALWEYFGLGDVPDHELDTLFAILERVRRGAGDVADDATAAG